VIRSKQSRPGRDGSSAALLRLGRVNLAPSPPLAVTNSV
jgi:hypothetical protein